MPLIVNKAGGLEITEELNKQREAPGPPGSGQDGEEEWGDVGGFRSKSRRS